MHDLKVGIALAALIEAMLHYSLYGEGLLSAYVI